MTEPRWSTRCLVCTALMQAGEVGICALCCEEFYEQEVRESMGIALRLKQCAVRNRIADIVARHHLTTIGRGEA